MRAGLLGLCVCFFQKKGGLKPLEMNMGFFLGLFSSATFGLIPLFSLPLIHGGLEPDAALFYRFLIASVILGSILVLRREGIRTSRGDLLKLAGMSFMYTAAALLLFRGFRYLPSGVATTIQFLYPVMVMLIMTAFFNEKFSWMTGCSVVLAVLGVGLLSGSGTSVSGADGGASVGGFSGEEGRLRLVGVGMMLLSGLCNAIYIVGIHVGRVRGLSGVCMTFYLLLFGALYTGINTVATGTFRLLVSWEELGMAVLLALITAVLSNLTLVLAVQRIGSTLTSVLGVMEPLTAVFVGILVFGEPFTPALVAGVALVAAAVLVVMLARQIRALAAGVFRS